MIRFIMPDVFFIAPEIIERLVKVFFEVVLVLILDCVLSNWSRCGDLRLILGVVIFIFLLGVIIVILLVIIIVILLGVLLSVSVIVFVLVVLLVVVFLVVVLVVVLLVVIIIIVIIILLILFGVLLVVVIIIIVIVIILGFVLGVSVIVVPLDIEIVYIEVVLLRVEFFDGKIECDAIACFLTDFDSVAVTNIAFDPNEASTNVPLLVVVVGKLWTNGANEREAPIWVIEVTSAIGISAISADDGKSVLLNETVSC